MGRLARLRQLSRYEVGLLIKALVGVASVRLGLVILPFARVRRILSRLRRSGETLSSASHSVSSSGASPPTDLTAVGQQLAWAVDVASERVPGGENCLVRALTLHTWLARLGHPAELRIGVRPETQSGMAAHAWVEVDGQVLIGSVPELDLYRPLAGPMGTSPWSPAELHAPGRTQAKSDRGETRPRSKSPLSAR